MSEAQPQRHTGRSIVALLAGFVFVVVISLGTDTLLRVLRIFPVLGQPMSNTLFLLATVYRTAYGLVGSYLTARLAPDRPMGHALVGGAVGLVLATIGAVTTWNRGPDFGPHWYPVALLALAMPQSWLGGKLRELQLR